MLADMTVWVFLMLIHRLLCSRASGDSTKTGLLLSNGVEGMVGKDRLPLDVPNDLAAMVLVWGRAQEGGGTSKTAGLAASVGNLYRLLSPACGPTDSSAARGVGTCPRTWKDGATRNLCVRHTETPNSGDWRSAPVRDSSGAAFANIYCAACNGAKLAPAWTVGCVGGGSATPSSTDRAGREGDAETPGRLKRNKPQQPLGNLKLPMSFTILLNFGFDGKSHILFSVTHRQTAWNHQCGRDEIYDPYKRLCRPVRCEKGYRLQHGYCKRVAPDRTDSSRSLLDPTPSDRTKMDDIELVVLQANVTYTGCPVFTQQTDEFMMAEIGRLVNISRLRIKNFTVDMNPDPDLLGRTVEQHSQSIYWDFGLEGAGGTDGAERQGRSMKITFLLMPPKQVSAGKNASVVVRDLQELVDSDEFLFHLNSSTIKVTSLRKVADPIIMKTWCGRGVKRLYPEADFTIIDAYDSAEKKNVISSVYINATHELYGRGQFDLTFLVRTNIRENTSDVTGFVFVCDMPRLMDMQCGRIQLNDDEYTLLPNKSVSYSHQVLGITQYQFTLNGSIEICIPDCMRATENGKIITGCDLGYKDALTIAQRYLTAILGILSLLAMILVMFTYCLFQKLRNIPGVIIMSLTSALLLAEFIFLVFSTVDNAWCCKFVAISLHYLFLASIFWMNVMAYDVFLTFGKKYVLSKVRDKGKIFPLYSLYAWGSPMAIVLVCVVIDLAHPFPGVSIGYGNGRHLLRVNHTHAHHYVYSPVTNMTGNLAVRAYHLMFSYRRLGCWIQKPVASMIAFGVPSILLILVNITLFTRTIICIRRTMKLVHFNLGRTTAGRRDVMLYVRMSVVMGFTWSFGLASSAASSGADPTKTMCLLLNVLGTLFIAFNCSQGIFICFAFVMNRHVMNMYKEWLVGLAERAKIINQKPSLSLRDRHISHLC